MSLFRKPKKPIQRRVFTSYDDDDEEGGGTPAAAATTNNGADSVAKDNRMEVDPSPPPPPSFSGSDGLKRSKKDKKDKKSSGTGSGGSSSASGGTSKATSKMSLLSFDDEGNNFRVSLLCWKHSDSTQLFCAYELMFWFQENVIQFRARCEQGCIRQPLCCIFCPMNLFHPCCLLVTRVSRSAI
ncbi:hypothetical protein RP20_CCG016615 [Aedes albopictus]|nr:hypothetical protein RP20_CCG016615 [Aedes albopictus]